MTNGKAGRVSIGFHGGQVLGVRLTTEQATALQEALTGGGGGGWHDLEAEDGPVLLDLAQVAYVRSESDEHRVGFSLG